MKKLILTFALSSILLLSFSGCGGQPSTTTAPAAQPTTTENQITSATPSLIDEQLSMPKKGDKVATIQTSMGDIKVKFFPQYAPKAVQNFQGLAIQNYYKNSGFHRIIENFMIQGGSKNNDGSTSESIFGSGFDIETSYKLFSLRGALAMANAGPGTNGSQFYIVQNKDITSDFQNDLKTAGYSDSFVNRYVAAGGYPGLDPALLQVQKQTSRYTVFGQVYAGMDIVDKIASTSVKTDPNSGENSTPVNPVKIINVQVSTY
jgi:cyclophilin family peptidyl-prolyl cis-trans isomerase